MTRFVDIIVAGRRPRPVPVERKRRRPWCRRDLHAMGLAAVADELGLAAMLDMGGIMTGARRRALLARPPKGVRFGNDKNGAPTTERPCSSMAATPDSVLQNGGRNMPEIMQAGLLAADVCRLIRPATGSFGRDLWGEA